MLNKSRITWDEIGVTAEIAAFTTDGTAGDGTAEYHVMLHVEPRRDLFEGQLQRLYLGMQFLTELPLTAGARIVAKRYYLSDSTNQQPLMKAETGCASACIQQAPLDGSKVAVWVYMVRAEGLDVHVADGVAAYSHNGYTHLWTMGMSRSEGDSSEQTDWLLRRYEQMLSNRGASLADNCIRTWFFVRDVDTQYAGMVDARRENFISQGLTQTTHYISSTGIGGNPADTRALVQMDAYSLTGFQPSQQRYLYAKSHLSPTYDYGVTFERGTLMEYGDRGHIFISGTASIDSKGEVLHIGDIVRQTERMWENVEALLAEGEMTFADVMQITVYLRDIADYATVEDMFRRRFPDTPYVITLAPVCRPAWLIEMECIAVCSRKTEYPDL